MWDTPEKGEIPLNHQKAQRNLEQPQGFLNSGERIAECGQGPWEPAARLPYFTGEGLRALEGR